MANHELFGRREPLKIPGGPEITPVGTPKKPMPLEPGTHPQQIPIKPPVKEPEKVPAGEPLVPERTPA